MLVTFAKRLGFLVALCIGGGFVGFLSNMAFAQDALVVAPNGRVGIGMANPGGNLHIFGGATQDIFNGIGPDPVTGPAMNFGYSGNSFGRGSGFFNVRPDASATGINPSLRFATNNFQRMVVTNIGRVGIGTVAPTQRLDVNGNIRTSGNFIAGGTTLNVPDYVFEPDYTLTPLPELAAYIQREKHLPDLPSAAEIKAEGLNLTEFQMGLLKKVEELTLYTLAQEKTITTQASVIEELTRSNQAQEQTITELQGQGVTIKALQGSLEALTERLAALEQASARR